MARERLSDLAICLRYFREGLGWSQVRLAEVSGYSNSLICDYETGQRELHRERLEHLISFMGLGPERIEAALTELAEARAAARLQPGDPFDSRRRRIEAIAAQFGRLAAGFARAALNLLTIGSEALHAHDQADHLWRKLKRYKPEDQLVVVEEDRRYWQWGLAVLLGWESLAAAPNQPKESLRLAKLALRIAELLPGDQDWRWRPQGYCLGIVSNGYRVCNDLPEARKARARARQLWDDGAPGDPGLLNEALLPWIEAALHRDERDFLAALKKIAEALARDNGELKGKILLTKANIHYTLGEPEASAAANLEALPLLDTEREPRLAWSVRHNLVSDLLDLGRGEEARQRLPEVRRLAERLGGELDLTRGVWMEALVADALGNLEEARARFEQVRRAFDKPELIYDYALASLDLSLVCLKQDDTAQVRTIAAQMMPIFESQQVRREALAALRVFCEAAKREAATVELAKEVVRYLRRAQDDPELRFEQAGAE
jgi:transcriptional regulator with XRE-family HTH domain